MNAWLIFYLLDHSQGRDHWKPVWVVVVWGCWGGFSMNVSRGLWRAWIFVSVLWIFGTIGIAALVLPDNSVKKYSYVYVMRSDVPDPNKVDWTKDFYDLMQSPARDHLVSDFHVLEYRLEPSWDDDVKKGTLISADFPDKSRLYLSAHMTKEDQNYVSK